MPSPAWASLFNVETAESSSSPSKKLRSTPSSPPCRSKTDLHTKRTGHSDYTDLTSETAKPIDLEAPPKPAPAGESSEMQVDEEMVVPEVDAKLMEELEGMGFAAARATRALHYSAADATASFSRRRRCSFQPPILNSDPCRALFQEKFQEVYGDSWVGSEELQLQPILINFCRSTCEFSRMHVQTQQQQQQKQNTASTSATASAIVGQLQNYRPVPQIVFHRLNSIHPFSSPPPSSSTKISVASSPANMSYNNLPSDSV